MWLLMILKFIGIHKKQLAKIHQNLIFCLLDNVLAHSVPVTPLKPSGYVSVEIKPES